MSLSLSISFDPTDGSLQRLLASIAEVAAQHSLTVAQQLQRLCVLLLNNLGTAVCLPGTLGRALYRLY